MAGGGSRKKREKPHDGGVLGVLIGQGAPGRGEQRLGAVDLALGNSTASGRSGQRRCAWRGWRGGSERVWDACARGKVPRGGPGGAGGLPKSIWPRTRRGRGPPAAYGGRWAEQRNREERDGGEGVFVISENPGTSR